MKLTFALFAVWLSAASLLAQSPSADADLQEARKLFQRQNAGETLTLDEKATIERAKALHAAQNAKASRQGSSAAGDGSGVDWDKARKLFQREQAGDPLNVEERAYLDHAKEVRKQGGGGKGNVSAAGQRKAPEHQTPLTDLPDGTLYEGEDGGLYGKGANTPSPEHTKTAQAQLAKIQPLDPTGNPAPDGKIVFVALSMSNATQEFSRFKRDADEAPEKSPKVTIVDCAQGGQAMAEWAPPHGAPWTEARNRLSRAGVTPQQVQAAWIKLANKGPSGSLQEHGRKLEADTLAMLHNARAEFPNLRIAYLGSRTYGGYAVNPLNPEPYAFESAFAARWLIQRQIKGDPELSESKAPVLLWGPYLWADGTRGRKIDGLVWERSDFGPDGTHPSESGREKVAQLLLKFFTTDPLAKSWFAR